MAGRFSPWYHQLLTVRLAKQLALEGYRNVRANVWGFSQPKAIATRDLWGRHVPDVTAEGDRRWIFEVETLDSLKDHHIRYEWTAFRDFAREADARFCVVVPKGLGKAAARTLAELDVDAEVRELSLLP
jgi:hypothetical protein